MYELLRNMSNPEIVNVVATADLGQRVNLIHILNIEYGIYNKEIYHGRVAYLKRPEMYGKVTIFSSGKLISIGTKNPKQAQKDLEITVETLVEKKIIKPLKIKAEVRNIVAVLSLGRQINLEVLSRKVEGVLNRQKFPGVIIKQENSKITYLVFHSGKIVITGNKSMDDLYKAEENIREVIDIVTN